MKYDPDTVALIKSALDEGTEPKVVAKDLGMNVQAVQGIIRAAGNRGWDALLEGEDMSKQTSRRGDTKVPRAEESASQRRKWGSDEPMNLAADKDQFSEEKRQRWFLDKPGNIQRAARLGYVHVDDAHAHSGGQGHVDAVAKHNGYGADKMMLLEIPNELHTEDQKSFAKHIDSKESGIRGSKATTPLAAMAAGQKEYVTEVSDRTVTEA